MYEVRRNTDEIDDVLSKAQENADGGSQWPGMSYEQGVVEAILWLTGQTDENPMAE